jgi:hypothetical protein
MTCKRLTKLNFYFVLYRQARSQKAFKDTSQNAWRQEESKRPLVAFIDLCRHLSFVIVTPNDKVLIKVVLVILSTLGKINNMVFNSKLKWTLHHTVRWWRSC